MAKIRVAKAAECLPVNGFPLSGELVLQTLLVIIDYLLVRDELSVEARADLEQTLIGTRDYIERVITDTWETPNEPPAAPAGE